MVVGCSQPPSQSSNSGGDSVSDNRSSSYVASSPQDAVDKLNAAARAKNWDMWVSCLAPQGELQICGIVMNMRPISQVINGPVPEHLNLTREEARKLKSWARKTNTVLQKYGISSATDVRKAKRNLLLMKNRSSLVRDFIDCAVDPDAPPQIVAGGWPFTATFEIVGEFQVEGNRAEGEYRIGDDSTGPISLKRMDGQWRINQLGQGGVASY